jgi:ribosomal protein S18 acetylase RimI-like enzyme
MIPSDPSPDRTPPLERAAPARRQVERLPDYAGPPAGLVLARAFYHDPMFVYLLPAAATRGGRLRWFMERGLATGRLFGAVDAVLQDGQPDGLAIWIRPEQTDLGPAQMLRTGVAALPIRFGLGGFRRFVKLVALSEAARRVAMPEPHWSLLTLGVDPARQRAGVGGALVRHGTARADAAGVPCFLETMNEANLPFYRRAGFRVVHEAEVPGGGLHVWSLRRDVGGG